LNIKMFQPSANSRNP